MIPVARNVWQHVEGGSPAAEARRLIAGSAVAGPRASVVILGTTSPPPTQRPTSA